MPNPNFDLLILAARQLRPLLSEIIFVGGCATGLLVNDPGTTPVRGTYDVDVIAEIASYAEYTLFSERLHALGFCEDDSERAPLCRWKYGSLTLDVMPLDASVLGFTNRWYSGALRTASPNQLSADLTVRAISAPYFLATKLEAFRGRGKGDYFASHDLEDFITVVDGRESVMNEVVASSMELRKYLAETVQSLLAQPRFLDALPGHLLPDEASQSRLGQLIHKLRRLSQISKA